MKIGMLSSTCKQVKKAVELLEEASARSRLLLQ